MPLVQGQEELNEVMLMTSLKIRILDLLNEARLRGESLSEDDLWTVFPEQVRKKGDLNRQVAKVLKTFENQGLIRHTWKGYSLR